MSLPNMATTSLHIRPQLNQFSFNLRISKWSKFNKTCRNFLYTQIVCSSFASKLNVPLAPSQCGIGTLLGRHILAHNSFNSCLILEFRIVLQPIENPFNVCRFRLFASCLPKNSIFLSHHQHNAASGHNLLLHIGPELNQFLSDLRISSFFTAGQISLHFLSTQIVWSLAA